MKSRFRALVDYLRSYDDALIVFKPLAIGLAIILTVSAFVAVVEYFFL